jgi:hypothetical protein
MEKGVKEGDGEVKGVKEWIFPLKLAPQQKKSCVKL